MSQDNRTLYISILTLTVGVCLLGMFQIGKHDGFSRGYRTGVSVGHTQGVQHAIDQNTSRVNQAIHNTYIWGCTDALRTSVVQLGISPDSVNDRIEIACQEEVAGTLPYYNLTQ